MEIEKKNKSCKKKMIVFVIIAAAILILAAAGTWIYDRYQLNNNGAPSYSKDAVDWDGSFGEEAEEGMINIPGYETIPLQAGSDTAKIELVNPDTNECLFQFELILKDTDEVLYTSDLVLPGKAIMSQKLSRALEAGDYNMIIRINTFSMDGTTPYNGADVEVPLHVYEE